MARGHGGEEGDGKDEGEGEAADHPFSGRGDVRNPAPTGGREGSGAPGSARDAPKVTRRAAARSPGRPWAWVPATVLFVGALAACEPPDRPPAATPGLPPAAVELLEPDRTRTFQIDEGVVYREVRSGREPWIVHLLEVDLARCDLGFRVEGNLPDPTRARVTDLARRAEPGVVGAVNGDFYTPEDQPLGIEASRGSVRGRGNGSVFAWRPGSAPWIGPVGWEGDSLRVGDWVVAPGLPDGETEIVSGYPALLDGGEWVGDLLQSERPAFAAERHPRTAVAHDAAGERLWLVVADGRREGVSEGMTLPELARLLQALGAERALNLDGGGSSTMVIRGQPVNRPSDLQGERPVANALVVRRDSAYCATARAALPR